MKKLFAALFFIGFAHFSFAQTVIKGKDVLDGKLEEGYYILLKIDDKDLEKEWQDFLKDFGKVSTPQKKYYTLTNFRDRAVANKDLTLQTRVVDFKRFTKIFCVVDGSKEPDFNENAFIEFIEKFVKEAQLREEVRLATIDLQEAEGLLKDAERDQKKVEKSLENNLKAQEKYGKILDASPEKMVALIEEKQGLLDQQLLTETTNEELKKQSEKKEKEIVKTQKDEKKYTSKLADKEDEFDKLRKDLFDVKKQVRFAQDVVDAKQIVLKMLNR